VRPRGAKTPRRAAFFTGSGRGGAFHPQNRPLEKRMQKKGRPENPSPRRPQRQRALAKDSGPSSKTGKTVDALFQRNLN